jgi:hypothetical protein
MYGSEIWIVRKKGKHRLSTTEMKFFRRTVRYTVMDHRKNEEIIQDVHMAPILERKNTKEIAYSMFQEWNPSDCLRKLYSIILKEKKNRQTTETSD